MSIFSRIAESLGFGGGESRPEISNATYSSAVMDAFGVGSAGQTVSATTAMRVSAVAACVAKISGAIVSMPIHVYRLNGDIPDRLPRDDLWYKLNEQPSPQFSAASHWECVSMSQLLRGDGFTYIKRGFNGTIRELIPLPWGAVTPVRTLESGVRYYINLPSHGLNIWVESGDMLHFPGLGFDDVTMRSMSVIAYGARNAISNAMAMDEYSGKFFEGGAHPSIILNNDKKMSNEQITQLQDAFTRKYAGLENAHRLPLVLTEGTTAKEISLSAEDAQLLEARKFQVLDVARAFGVPGFLINESTGATSWGSGIESIGRAFVQYTLQPWLRKIEQELNRKLFPRDTGKFVEFYRDALIEGDSAAQGSYFRSALGGPGMGDAHMTVNEVRKIKRMAAVSGGDEIYRAPRDKPAPDTTKQDAAVADVANTLREMRHSNELQSERITNRLDNQPAPAPVINVAAPIVNVAPPAVSVNVEKPDAPVVNNVINLPEPVINVEAVMPESQPPVVNIAPQVVNVAPQVVNVGETVVNVAPAEVSVNLPDRRIVGTVERNSSGQITKTIQTETDL